MALKPTWCESYYFCTWADTWGARETSFYLAVWTAARTTASFTPTEEACLQPSHWQRWFLSYIIYKNSQYAWQWVNHSQDGNNISTKSASAYSHSLTFYWRLTNALYCHLVTTDGAANIAQMTSMIDFVKNLRQETTDKTLFLIDWDKTAFRLDQTPNLLMVYERNILLKRVKNDTVLCLVY